MKYRVALGALWYAFKSAERIEGLPTRHSDRRGVTRRECVYDESDLLAELKSSVSSNGGYLVFRLPKLAGEYQVVLFFKSNVERVDDAVSH